MEVKFDDMEFQATEEFVDAIKQLITAEIKMMRSVDIMNKECWTCGGCRIGNLNESNTFVFIYGGTLEVDYIKESSDVFVHIFDI